MRGGSLADRARKHTPNDCARCRRSRRCRCSAAEVSAEGGPRTSSPPVPSSREQARATLWTFFAARGDAAARGARILVASAPRDLRGLVLGTPPGLHRGPTSYRCRLQPRSRSRRSSPPFLRSRHRRPSDPRNRVPANAFSPSRCIGNSRGPCHRTRGPSIARAEQGPRRRRPNLCLSARQQRTSPPVSRLCAPVLSSSAMSDGFKRLGHAPSRCSCPPFASPRGGPGYWPVTDHLRSTGPHRRLSLPKWPHAPRDSGVAPNRPAPATRHFVASPETRKTLFAAAWPPAPSPSSSYVRQPTRRAAPPGVSNSRRSERNCV